MNPAKKTNQEFYRSFLKLIRWPNLIIIFLTQYIVFLFIMKNGQGGPERFVPHPEFFLLTAGTILIAAAGYIINDYYDIKIDLVNKPSRIVIGRYISRRQAILVHSFLNITAIALGLLLSWRVALYLAGSAFLLWLYSNYLKRTPLLGNVMISLLTAATIWIISLYYRENDSLIYTYSVFAFFISLVREIIKDMEDTKGDATYGCRTLPIVAGIRRTKAVVVLVLVLFSLLLIQHLHSHVRESGSFLHFLLLIPLIYITYRTITADKQKDYSDLSQFCKWFMLAGVISLGFV